PLTFARFKEQAERIAGYLQHDLNVAAGDRVLLVMQNSPQFVLAYYGILRANAIVVPVNPMSVTAGLDHFVRGSGAKVALVAQEVFPQLRPLMAGQLQHVVVAAYSDYIDPKTSLRMPEIVSAPRQAIDAENVTLWADALAAERTPGALTAG